jgi:hypothetical protein
MSGMGRWMYRNHWIENFLVFALMKPKGRFTTKVAVTIKRKSDMVCQSESADILTYSTKYGDFGQYGFCRPGRRRASFA